MRPADPLKYHKWVGTVDGGVLLQLHGPSDLQRGPYTSIMRVFVACVALDIHLYDYQLAELRDAITAYLEGFPAAVEADKEARTGSK